MSESMTSQEYLDHMNGGRQKDPKQVLKGKRAQSQGKHFEHDINLANGEYQRLGMARIEQLPVETQPMPTKWLTREHQPKSGICRILAQRAPFDYYGTLGLVGARPPENRGRAIAMECKSSGVKTSMPIGEKSGLLKPHQLHACAESFRLFGTITVIVWLNGDQRGVLTPDRIVNADQRYRIQGARSKSIPWSQFMPYKRERIQEHGPIIDNWIVPVLSFINFQAR